MSICFVTDQRPGETDILQPVCREVLRILDLDGGLLAEIPSPVNGWSHDRLCQAGLELQHTGCLDAGANAYLGTSWVGSTEV